jgi:probable H4MPT-linked C1 transfer pathway protein
VRAKIIGWDIGGAHLKAAVLNETGQVIGIVQEPCPLWQGIEPLMKALDRVFDALSIGADCRHAVTMTGELVDYFHHREQGVLQLTQLMAERCGSEALLVFAGSDGFLKPENITPLEVIKIASANWLASAFWVAEKLKEALFIDIGSTTTDLVTIAEHRVMTRGYTDYERMRYDELFYSGVVRTPIMAFADQLPFEGEWISLMAEHFATTADLYRLTGELPERADLLPSADGDEKTIPGSARRLARLVGRDLESAPLATWRQAARFLREQHLGKIRWAIDRQLSRGLLSEKGSWVGAGVGRFLVRELAARSGYSYVDFNDLFSMATPQNSLNTADCAPAAAVAGLAKRRWFPDA